MIDKTVLISRPAVRHSRSQTEVRSPTEYNLIGPPEAPLSVRIFVVDDNCMSAHRTAEVLVRSGYCATWFTDPLEALAISLEVKPDMLIAKLLMPSLNGIDLAIEIASGCPLCKYVLFSDHIHPSDSVRYSRMLGHNLTFWELPVRTTSILSEIRRIFVRVSNDRRVLTH
jgi:CheY-like chemotaxis protein